MIQQIQSEEDDEIIGSENVGESSSDVNDGNAEDQTAVDSPRTVSESATVEWRVVSVNGVKTADHNQYVDCPLSTHALIMLTPSFSANIKKLQCLQKHNFHLPPFSVNCTGYLSTLELAIQYK